MQRRSAFAGHFQRSMTKGDYSSIQEIAGGPPFRATFFACHLAAIQIGNRD